MGWADINSGLLPYGEVWRSHKRIYQDHLRPSILSTYYPLHNRSVGKLLRDIVQSPDNLLDHLRLYV